MSMSVSIILAVYQGVCVYVWEGEMSMCIQASQH